MKEKSEQDTGGGAEAGKHEAGRHEEAVREMVGVLRRHRLSYEQATYVSRLARQRLKLERQPTDQRFGEEIRCLATQEGTFLPC